MLHLIDNLDARMNTLDKAYAQTEPGSFTSRLFPMENRRFTSRNRKRMKNRMKWIKATDFGKLRGIIR